MNAAGSRLPEFLRPGRGIDEQAGAARLQQQLTAPPARQQRLAVGGHHAHRDESGPGGPAGTFLRA